MVRASPKNHEESKYQQLSFDWTLILFITLAFAIRFFLLDFLVQFYVQKVKRKLSFVQKALSFTQKRSIPFPEQLALASLHQILATSRHGH